MKIWKRLKVRWILLAGLPLVVAGGYLFAQAAFRGRLTEELTAALGMPAKIGSVAPGFRWHRAENIRILNAETSSPLVSIQRLHVELPLWQAIVGNLRPRRIVLEGVSVVIELDQDGRPIGIATAATPPKELPSDNIEVRRAGVEVRQRGRNPLATDDIAAQLHREAGQISVTATVAELLGGSWFIDGQLSSDSQRMAASFRTTDLSVDSEQLTQLAGFPSWDPSLLRAQAVASLSGRIEYDTQRGLTYRTEVKLPTGKVHVQKNELTVDQISGTGLIEDGLMTIPKLSGRVFGANLVLNGTLDTLTDGEGGRFTITLDGLDVDQLPLEAEVLGEAKGAVSGSAEFRLNKQDVGWQLAGAGKGTVDDAAWRDIPIEQLTCQFTLPSWLVDTSLQPPKSGQLQTEFRLTGRMVPDLVEALAPDLRIQRDQLEGSVSLAGQVTVPLQSVKQIDTFTANATLTADDVRVVDFRLPQFAARLQLAQGRIELPHAVARLQPSGQVTASGAMELEPDGRANLKLKLVDVPVAIAELFIPEKLPKLLGVVSGDLQAEVPTSGWNHLAGWQGSADLLMPWLNIGAVQLTHLSTHGELKEKRLSLSESKLTWQDTPLTATATIRLDEALTFQVNGTSGEFDLQRLLKVAGIEADEAAAGKLAVTGDLRGQLSPLQWDAGGGVRISELELWGNEAANLDIPWTANRTNLRLRDATVSLLGGTIQLNATLPWQSLEDAQVDGNFHSLHTNRLNTLLDNLPATVSGPVSGTFSASGFKNPQQLRAHIDFDGLEAESGVVKLAGLSGSLDAGGGKLTLASKGSALGGSVAVKGHAEFPAEAWQPSVSSGSASFRNIRLQALWPVLGLQQRLGPLRAIADADIALVTGTTRPEGTGSLELRDVQWGTRPLTEVLNAQVKLSEERFRVSEARCRLGRGVLTGEVQYRLDEQRGELILRSQRVPIDYLLAEWPKAARQARGTIDADLKGVIGQQWDLRGTVNVSRGRFAGIPVQSVRAPVRWRIRPNTGAWEGNLELKNARIASGTATGKWQLGWNGIFYMTGATTMQNLDVRPLAASVPGVNNLLSGRLSGNFSLESRNLRTPHDLSGAYRLKLEQSQTLLLPILESLTASLGLASPTSLTFTRTDIVGRLGRGVMKVEEMSMVGPQARMWVVGQMGLGGVIDFDVTADTGGFSGVNLLAGAINPIELLRRRLVFLHLSGSIRNPIVQPRTEQFLAQEVVLFFLPVISIR